MGSKSEGCAVVEEKVLRRIERYTLLIIAEKPGRRKDYGQHFNRRITLRNLMWDTGGPVLWSEIKEGEESGGEGTRDIDGSQTFSSQNCFSLLK